MFPVLPMLAPLMFPVLPMLAPLMFPVLPMLGAFTSASNAAMHAPAAGTSQADQLWYVLYLVYLLLLRIGLTRMEKLDMAGPAAADDTLKQMLLDSTETLRLAEQLVAAHGFDGAELAWHNCFLLLKAGNLVQCMEQAAESLAAMQRRALRRSIVVLKLRQLAVHAWLLEHKGAQHIDEWNMERGEAMLQKMHDALQQLVAWIGVKGCLELRKKTNSLYKAMAGLFESRGISLVVSARACDCVLLDAWGGGVWGKVRCGC
jgi:hypothetical protein